MSGTRGFSDAVRGVGRNTLDVPVAILAGLAVVFAAFAIPPEPLADLVGATGLPQYLPAAEPPLGAKARIGLGLVGAVLVFTLVFGLLRLLGRKPDRPAKKSVEAPRLRRRDSHPDAPSRRPISATLEFGEPAPGPSEPRPAPAWLSPAELQWDEEPAETPDYAEPIVAQEMAPVEVEPTPEVRLPIEEPVTSEASAPEVAPSIEPAHTRAPAHTETIAQLIARLEQGLSRRQPDKSTLIRQPDNSTLIRQAVKAASEPTPSADGDDRLQSAIDSLQRLASRQG